MEKVNEQLNKETNFNDLKSKNEFNISELEQILKINAKTIIQYSSQFKHILSSTDNFNQKDVQTLLLIQSMKKNGLNLTQITDKVCEYQQLLRQTLDGTSKNPVKYLVNYPQAKGLTGLIS